MRKNTFILSIFGLAAIIAFSAVTISLLLNQNRARHDSRPSVAATVFPLYDIVRRVAGEGINVVLVLPPGASPHTFEPSPSTYVKLRDASALYAIGLGLDAWAANLVAGSEVEIVTVEKGIALRHIDEDEHEDGEEDGHDEHEHHHGGADPHYWLSTRNAKLIAANVAEDLKRRFPDAAAEIDLNLAAYSDELDGADRQIRSVLSGIERREMVTLHDAWYYFAEEYGLTVAASFEPSPGREPTPQYLAALGHAVTTNGIRTIYSEPQLSTASLLPFTQDHNIKITVLDPLGGVPGRESFIDMMLYNAQTIAQNQ